MQAAAQLWRPGAVPSVMLAGGSFEQRKMWLRNLTNHGVVVTAHKPELIISLDDALISDLRRAHPNVPILAAGSNDPEAFVSQSIRYGASPVFSPSPTALMGDCAPMCELRANIRKLGAAPCSVLVVGETGTGKDLVARMLHDAGPRAAQPFVAINCAAIPEGLMEGELFGFERGAFTGAVAASSGKLASANGGTVFLDEVAELPLSLQAKLLRVIEQREMQRLGARSAARIDVRWIAATNRDLALAAHQGHFRLDLLYRLRVAELRVPALRQRGADVAALARYFLDRLAAEYQSRAIAFSTEVLQLFMTHDWPGNVRELRNAVESSLIHATGNEIQIDDLPPSLVLKRYPPNRCTSNDASELQGLLDAVKLENGNKSKAAERLHCSRMTLYRRLARYGIRVTARDTPDTT